jgi:pimeloyl-ACP methyl ester carboxylesterase
VRDYWVSQAPRYRGPVLVVWGRQDAVLPMASAADAREVMPQARIQIIDQCGHLPMIERPDEFLAALLPFLDRAEAAAAA